MATSTNHAPHLASDGDSTRSGSLPDVTTMGKISKDDHGVDSGSDDEGCANFPTFVSTNTNPNAVAPAKKETAVASGTHNDRMEEETITIGQSSHADSTDATPHPTPVDSGILEDILHDVLGYLGWKDILRARGCSIKWRDMATRVHVAPAAEHKRPVTFMSKFTNPEETCCEFQVYSPKRYNALVGLTRVLPNLHQIELRSLGYGHKYGDGEDPWNVDDLWSAADALDDTELEAYIDELAECSCNEHSIAIIENFRQLRNLYITGAQLNGTYRSLFNFPHLRRLHISNALFLKWDLELLRGLPSLEELIFTGKREFAARVQVKGNIQSLRIQKDTLKKVHICHCNHIEGDLTDLADFPYLAELNLFGTSVKGDVRNIQANHFPAIKHLSLPDTVHGASTFKRIDDVPGTMKTISFLKKRTPTLFRGRYWYLSESSLDWYRGSAEPMDPKPPFGVELVKAGKRIGWRWTNAETRSLRRNFAPCEVNWIDPEPSEGEDYAVYEKELHNIRRGSDLYRGLYQPPTMEEYKKLLLVRNV